MSEPQIQPGDRVWYVPHLDHWSDGDAFSFVHADLAPPLPLARQQAGERRAQAGDPYEGSFKKRSTRADPPGDVEKVDADGVIHLASGVRLRPHRPRAFWPAVVREEVTRTPREAVAVVEGKEQTVHVFDETRRLVLDVRHSDGHTTLHLPLEGPAAVPHDSAKRLHTWHREGE